LSEGNEEGEGQVKASPQAFMENLENVRLYLAGEMTPTKY
jgi:hypothetical protein